MHDYNLKNLILTLKLYYLQVITLYFCSQNIVHLINHLLRPIFVTNFDAVELFNNLDILQYSIFIILFSICLIFLLFSGGIIISSTGSYFIILSLFDIFVVSGVLFSKYSPALWITFLEASNPLSNNVFYIFLQTIKIHIL